MSLEKLFGDYYKDESGKRAPSSALPVSRVPQLDGWKILTRRRRVAVATVLILTFLSGIFLQNLIFKKQMDDATRQPLPQIPYQEKVADGAWVLKNRDPIREKIGSVPVSNILKENKEALEQVKRVASSEKLVASMRDKQIPDTDVYRWSVRLPSGTEFSFGLQDMHGIKPVVKVTNREGYFVRYYPAAMNNGQKEINHQPSTINNYVKPEVKGNVISWQIAPGITVRYTMMKDRIKEDYIVQDKRFLSKGSVDFFVESGKLDEAESYHLTSTLMPNGDILWLNESDKEIFTFPAPIATDSKKNKLQNTKYEIQDTGKAAGQSLLRIVLPEDEVDRAVFPLTIDPVVIDNANVVATATAYGNGSSLLRDAWGNLFAIYEGGSGPVESVAYKNYNSATWTITDDAGGFDYPVNKAAMDSQGNIWIVSEINLASNELDLHKVTVTRNASNLVTSVAFADNSYIDAGTRDHRGTIIMANKGMGGAAEQFVVAVAMNTTTGGTKRGEIRIMSCPVLTTTCNNGTGWRNVSNEIDFTGSCSDSVTSGAAGRSTTTTCKGGSDILFQDSTNHTLHNATVQQIPGRPKRSPEAAVLDLNSVQSNILNTRDNNTATSQHIGGLTTTDYIYVGDSTTFSKLAVDMNSVADGNVNAATFTTAQYCNAVSGSNCTNWASLSNLTDYTASAAAFSTDGAVLFDEPSDWVKASVNSNDNKYWIRIRPSAAFDSTVKVREFYITDRNARALLVVGGDADTQDLRAAYIPWDEINDDRWENRPDQAGNGWRVDAAAASSALADQGAEWDTWSNYPLSSTVDYINNRAYIAYVSGTDTISGITTIKSVPNNKDVTVAANWTTAAFPTTTEATDTNFSITSDGENIYLFYILDPGTNALVYQVCNPENAGSGNVCDNASDWGTTKTFDSTVTLSHPSAIVTKIPGDTAAIDVIYTDATALAVNYQRLFADVSYSSIATADTTDIAFHRDCVSGTDDIGTGTGFFGYLTSDSNCAGSVDSQNYTGYRFQNVNVSRGAKIASAYLDMPDTSGVTTTVDFTLYGEDVDNAAAFSTSTNCTDPCTNSVLVREQANPTTNTASFSMALPTVRWYRFDVTKIVQEIVCRGASNAQPCVGNFNNGSGAWTPTNALALFIISTGTTSGRPTTGAFGTSNPVLQINLGNSSYDFSMGAATKLASGSASYANFDHPMATSSGELGSVLTQDSRYASVSAAMQYASSSAVPAFMFKVNNTNNDNTYKIDATAVVKSTATASARPIYLQVYHAGSTNDWETVASNNSSPGGTDITLTMPRISSSTTEYYQTGPGSGSCNGSDCWVFLRLYQDAPGTNQNETLSVDYFNVTFTATPTKIAFTNSTNTFVKDTCSGAGNPFTITLEDDTDAARAPGATTVVRVTSNSSGAVVYSDSSCSTPVTNGDFTFTTSDSSKTFYVQDSVRGGFTLTATRQSGDTLTSDTDLYGVTISPLPNSSSILGGTNIQGGTTLR